MTIAPLFAALVIQEYLIVGFAALAGAVLGSFFNVVIYRWPRGKSIVVPPSSCPSCGGRIRARHNLPVLGWFLLRGKCFDCGAAISARYPLVEALSALTFALLAICEPVGGGANLPSPPPTIEIFAPSSNDLWLIFAAHATLLSSLLIAAGIDYDRKPLPRSLAILPLVVAFAAALYRPAVLPVPAFAEVLARLEHQQWAMGIVSSVYGAVAGGVFGCLLAPATGVGRSGLAGRVNGAVVTAWVGAFLGWQAVGMLAAASALVYMQAVMYRHGVTRLQQVTYPMILWLATLTWIPLWKTIVGRLPLGANADWRVISWQAGAVILCATATYWFRGPALPGQPQSPTT